MSLKCKMQIFTLRLRSTLLRCGPLFQPTPPPPLLTESHRCVNNREGVGLRPQGCMPAGFNMGALLQMHHGLKIRGALTPCTTPMGVKQMADSTNTGQGAGAKTANFSGSRPLTFPTLDPPLGHQRSRVHALSCVHVHKVPNTTEA